MFMQCSEVLSLKQTSDSIILRLYYTLPATTEKVISLLLLALTAAACYYLILNN
jgi:hypothetical protein